MDQASDDTDTWSDTDRDDGNVATTPLRSRAYQVEMFEKSMQGNIIAVMATGSGKTQIAKLRIEAELLRTVGKRIWFMAPSVVLAYQQYTFLSQQLPAAQFKLITGMNNPDCWRSQDIWDTALFNVDVVVCTPQILLDALDYGFVSFTNVSLLVIDEAHHCVANHPLNIIMRNHYHVSPNKEPLSTRPAILGLSASPVTKKSTVELQQLEASLDAKCTTPTQQLGEYTTHVNAPELRLASYSQKSPPFSAVLTALIRLNNDLALEDDPYVHKLRGRADLASQQKLSKILLKNRTPAMVELQSFSASTVAICNDLGTSAAVTYIALCLAKIRTASIEAQSSLTSSPEDSIHFISRILEPLHTMVLATSPGLSQDDHYSDKVLTLLQILKNEYHPETRALIFVKTRATAWALTRILQTHHLVAQYHSFSFVGCSNPAHRSAFDFSHLQTQNQDLEAFRRGELNLCVATSVMEEGIDVPAMNLVICFDKPSNLRSFLQSRGRARQQKSKYILLKEAVDVPRKLAAWQKVEEDMNLTCAQERRDWEELSAREDEEEAGGEVLRISSTGAVLTYENSQQRLQRFCARISRKGDPSLRQPVYVITCSTSSERRATVHLPAVLPPSLQIIKSKCDWKTEKMAKRDAAFQAYKLLHESGFVTDNLLPPETPLDLGSQEDCESRDIEKRDSVYAVAHQYDPWPSILQQFSTTTTCYCHAIEAVSSSRNFPPMTLVLPTRLDRYAFTLYGPSSERIEVIMQAGNCADKFPVNTARMIGIFLLDAILGRRMRGAEAADIPLTLVPDIPSETLEHWHAEHVGSRPLADCINGGGMGQTEYLLGVVARNVPYIFDPRGHEVDALCINLAEDTIIQARKLSRKLNYLAPSNDHSGEKSATKDLLPLGDCRLMNLPAEYGHFMLLVPSMTHMFEIALRSTEACRGPLGPIEFQDINLVAEALTLPAVSTKNYQRLEFIGDDLLKYFASVQVFVDHPAHPESLLGLYRDRIIANSRLQRATRSLGLDRYLTRSRFAQQKWQAGVSHHDPSSVGSSSKALSSKVLADVVEALIGAAKIDGAQQGASEVKVVTALKLFIDEIDWKTPTVNVASLTTYENPGLVAIERLKPVEDMLGYSFRNQSVLAEALTHSSYNSGISSYDRLEFLGDAILDHIVKTRLYESCNSFTPAEMTVRRHALVSHATLAFFALQASQSSMTFDMETNLVTKKVAAAQIERKVYLIDHVRRVEGREAAQEREKTLAALQEVQADIVAVFNHGTKFPWAKLLRLNAPKTYSDVFEAILGAVFVDSGASLAACERVLESLGFMKLLMRLSDLPEGDFDAEHPEGALQKMAINYELVAQRRSAAGWRCKVVLDGERIGQAKRATCKEEAQCRAAQHAIGVLSLRKKRKSSPGPSVGEEVQTSVEGFSTAS